MEEIKRVYIGIPEDLGNLILWFVCEYRKSTLFLLTLIALTIHSQAQTVTDIEGNLYNTVTIGEQIWLKENLKTTKYNDGIAIPLVANNISWSALITPAYCNYKNTTNADTINTYGRLYNWFTISTDKLCPTGWKVPTKHDWSILAYFTQNWNLNGGKLKEVDTIHWRSPNVGATNETNFTALPGGIRNYDGSFLSIGLLGDWWVYPDSNEPDPNNYYAWSRILTYNDSVGGMLNTLRQEGLSVRCIMYNFTSINNLNNLEVCIYPNPSSGKLYIKNVKSSNLIVSIYNLQGEQISKEQIVSNFIDISNLKTGIYLVKFNVSDKIMMFKINKE